MTNLPLSFSPKFATIEPDVTSILSSTIHIKFYVHEVAAYFENLEVDNLRLKNKISFQCYECFGTLYYSARKWT